LVVLERALVAVDTVRRIEEYAIAVHLAGSVVLAIVATTVLQQRWLKFNL